MKFVKDEKVDLNEVYNLMEDEYDALYDVSAEEFEEIHDFFEHDGYLAIEYSCSGEDFVYEVLPDSPKGREILWGIYEGIQLEARWASTEEYRKFVRLGYSLIKAVKKLDTRCPIVDWYPSGDRIDLIKCLRNIFYVATGQHRKDRVFQYTLKTEGIERAITARQFLRYTDREEEEPLYLDPQPWGQVGMVSSRMFKKQAKKACDHWTAIIY